jgi:uncharacterized membrane protein (UPF0127 family)
MVTLNVKILSGLREKSKGLIGADPVYPVFFTTRWGIHTFGVMHPIDVLILDDNNRVVTIRHRIPPNRFFFWNPFYKNVIELPAGEIDKRGIKTGEKILFHK